MPPLRDPWELAHPERLISKMQELDLSYRKLAARAGVGKTPIGKLLHGQQKTCSREVAERIAAALEVEADEVGFRPLSATQEAAST